MTPSPVRRRLRRILAISGIVLVAHLIGFATSVHALMATRTAQGAVAWIVSLNAMPYIAVPAYWVFGRSRFRGYESLRVEAGVEAPLEGELSALRPFHRQQEMDDLLGLVALERLARLPFTEQNATQLLIDGEGTYASIYEGFSEAQEYLLVQFYTIRDDDQGQEFKRQLIARAKAGVRVYLLIDEIGSLDLPKSYTSDLREAGVAVASFNSTQGLGNQLQLNFRNHRKVVVADGRSAWLGGLNISDDYSKPDWRDTHLRIDGPAALHLQLTFLEDWRWATGEMITLNWNPEPVANGSPVLILPSGPSGQETGSLMIQQIIHMADRRLWLASPYFVPDAGVVSSLRLAAISGVDVRLLLPEATDNLLTTLAVNTYFDPLIEAGVKIYRYQPGLMHGKFFLFDDWGAAVSTANLDNRSLRLNFELTAFVVSEDFNAEVAEMFAADFDRSRRMVPGEFAAEPFWYRAASRFANLFAPVL